VPRNQVRRGPARMLLWNSLSMKLEQLVKSVVFLALTPALRGRTAALFADHRPRADAGGAPADAHSKREHREGHGLAAGAGPVAAAGARVKAFARDLTTALAPPAPNGDVLVARPTRPHGLMKEGAQGWVTGL